MTPFWIWSMNDWWAEHVLVRWCCVFVCTPNLMLLAFVGVCVCMPFWFSSLLIFFRVVCSSHTSCFTSFTLAACACCGTYHDTHLSIQSIHTCMRLHHACVDSIERQHAERMYIGWMCMCLGSRPHSTHTELERNVKCAAFCSSFVLLLDKYVN